MIQPTTKRERAAAACRARFHLKPYSPGVRDCPLLALHDLRHVGVSVPWAKGLKWKTEAEGLRALKSLGFENLHQALDALGLPRIAPASALAADIIALPTTHKLGALSVAMGNGNVIGFIDGSPNAEIFSQTEFLTDEHGPCAWRVI